MACSIGIGLGTPQRIIDLLECGAMKTQALRRVVIDGSHLDQKKRSIFDMKELLGPLVKLLSTPALQKRLEAVEGAAVVLVF
jgi:protein CMS1